MHHSSIMSFSSYLPSHLVKTADLLHESKSQRYDFSYDYIKKNIGIRSVLHAKSEMKPSELASISARKCLKKTGMKSSDLDHIIFVGIEGDYIEPSTAHKVQKLIGGDAICFDVKNACLGFMSAIYAANALISVGAAKYVLVCTGEKNSFLTKKAISFMRSNCTFSDFKNALGFLTISDSGGSVILGPRGEGHNLVGLYGQSRGKYSQLCYYDYNNGVFDGQMEMARICSATINQHQRVYEHLSKSIGWCIKDIDWLVPHQVGEQPLMKFSHRLGIDVNKITLSYKNYGNLTTASIPVNMSLYEHNMKPGQKLYLAMSGSGICCQHAALEYNG